MILPAANEAGSQPVPDLRQELGHGLMQLAELAPGHDAVAAQLAPLRTGRIERLAKLTVELADQVGHLGARAILGLLGLGEQAVLAYLLLGRPELAGDLRDEALDRLPGLARRRLDRTDEARQKPHLVGMRNRCFLRGRVGDRDLGVGQAERHRLLDHGLVDQPHPVLAHQLREVLHGGEVRCPVRLRQPAQVPRRRVVADLLLHLPVGQPPDRHQGQRPERCPKVRRPSRRVLQLALADLLGPCLHLGPVQSVGQDDHRVIVGQRDGRLLRARDQVGLAAFAVSSSRHREPPSA
jgi:hypothetical protein